MNITYLQGVFTIIKKNIILLCLIVLITQHANALNIRNYFSPENNHRENRPYTWYIILHTTEGANRGSINKIFKNGEAHYFIDKKGQVLKIISNYKIAHHAGRSMWDGVSNINNYSIGIEVAGYHNDNITKKQYKSLKELLFRLQKFYNISDENVLTHSMVAYGNPNRWHKKPHRGRKRCGAIFAVRSVRKKLSLNQRKKYDPV